MFHLVSIPSSLTLPFEVDGQRLTSQIPVPLKDGMIVAFGSDHSTNPEDDYRE